MDQYSRMEANHMERQLFYAQAECAAKAHLGGAGMNSYQEFAKFSKESVDKWVNDTVQRLEARIRELEHQHKNDDAANQLLNEACESQRKRIKELEKCKPQESPSYPYC